MKDELEKKFNEEIPDLVADNFIREIDSDEFNPSEAVLRASDMALGYSLARAKAKRFIESLTSLN